MSEQNVSSLDTSNKEGQAIHSLLITGYKAHELGVFSEKHPGVELIKKTIKKRLIPFIEEGTEWFITSGQLGVEQWACDVVAELRESDYHQIRLAILPPFQSQEENWQENTKERYASRLEKADFVECISKRPYENPGQLKQKNDFLVQKTDALLVLYDEEKEGSPSFYVRSALSQNKPVYYISPEEIDEMAREEALGDW
ncbi:DUF1273 domain-containing protein [Shouchella patagoniensis]|uniref:DUF1273 domain-containing protein n=1 Tax=Shouchella patagoniensis TaxID=228576 RepID=UPI001FE4B404|nr:DUF1273 domain-containing protein [Shouchella patagoniensis]